MVYLALGIRCLVGFLFLASAVSKVFGRKSIRKSFLEFTDSVAGMPLAPRRGIPAVAAAVILAEAAVPVLLLLPGTRFRVAGFLAATALPAVFGLSIALALHRGAAPPCRCFGPSVTPLGARHLVRNTLLAALAAAGAVLAVRPAGPAHPGGAALAAAAGVLVAVLVAALDDIVQLFSPQETPHAVRDRGPAARRGAVRPGPGPHPGRDQAVA
ncbi:MauE/DoxX family redox-associated membrane protein [Streptomyces sp. NPDC101118]|uniref:MauE/DoxX family redox-associated membrane protein n=1 Tax=Streptomyces sp. NPDC101118 TaxID=3366109 RepID=UPI0037F182B0